MFIRGGDGVSVGLRPVRWQFGPDAGPWDDQWLVIGGRVDLGTRSWSFVEPCLLMDEARELGRWLDAAASGRIEPDPAATGAEASLSFLEPVLGFAVAARRAGEAVIRVHLMAEGAPPWLRAPGPGMARYAVELAVRPDQLVAAASAWTRELDALPARPGSTPAGT